MISSSALYCSETPIVVYPVAGRSVYVKREDLYGRPPAPPLGKLRGLHVVLQGLFVQGIRLIGCWDTRVSRLGEGLAAACLDFPGMRAIVSYPTRRGTDVPGPIATARNLGADLLPLRGNHVGICYAQARKQVEARGGWMLPFGLECREAVDAVALEASRTPRWLASGTIVLCCGSGVTLAGLIRGLPVAPSRVFGMSSGRSLTKIRACLLRYLEGVPPSVELLPSAMAYDEVPDILCPFPSHPNYDLKAWHWLVKEVRQLRDPILFWNIGA